MLLPFLRQEDGVLFSRTMHIHIQLLRHTEPFVTYNCPDQQDPQIFRQFNMMKWELHLFPGPTTTIAKLQQVQDDWDNLSQDEIRQLYYHLHVRIHACIAIRGGTL